MEFIRASFAVVGHPNKGKSSIVSTLAKNDRVAISRRSGTTKRSTYYKVDTGRAGFELIDTPGFQRPRKVLQWLQQKAQSADQHLAAIKAFIESPQCQQMFPDEVELLSPIVNGAAILYVVDGSRPYGKEYEVEMEILRWTGRPSMALINPIESEQYVAVWQAALNQFFKTVQIFNPLYADHQQQRRLLETFAHLEPRWHDSILLVIEDLKQTDNKLLQSSAVILADLLLDLCHHQLEQKVLTKSQAEKLKNIADATFKNWMVERERTAHAEILDLYQHSTTEFVADELVLPPDLFDSEKWFAWGLSKNELAGVGLITGAVGGGAIDVMFAGHSFLLGSLIGGMVGLSSAWFGADRMSETSIKGIPLGGFKAVQGPIKNPNFPYVVIGRFIYMLEQIKNRNHANRTALTLELNDATKNSLQKKMSHLAKEDLKILHQACRDLSAQKTTNNLQQSIRQLLLSGHLY